MSTAGEPTSVRLPVGTAAYIKEQTGRPAGEIIRQLTLTYVERLKIEAARGEEKK